jgi:hypothetical protein
MLTYGITPPKANNSAEKVFEIARRQIEQINSIQPDALIIYDIQDEADRTSESRPYPFLPTLDPRVYAEKYLQEITAEKILFRAVGSYSPAQLEAELINAPKGQRYVFVGASSGQQQVQVTLTDAFSICRNANPGIMLGGIMIPERHEKKHDEHIRVSEKTKNGCSFFISQAVYHAEASKNFLSDYYYLSRTTGVEMKPIMFTLTLCGSAKTLEFLNWLGVSVPKWVRNELLNAPDILQKSFDVSYRIFQELYSFAAEKNIPIGFNVESIAIRKDEIEASVQLFRKIKAEYKGGVGQAKPISNFEFPISN